MNQSQIHRIVYTLGLSNGYITSFILKMASFSTDQYLPQVSVNHSLTMNYQLKKILNHRTQSEVLPHIFFHIPCLIRYIFECEAIEILVKINSASFVFASRSSSAI